MLWGFFFSLTEKFEGGDDKKKVRATCAAVRRRRDSSSLLCFSTVHTNSTVWSC